MAAAPLPLADPEYSPVSPELALVDADLADVLRERLAGPERAELVPAFEPVVLEVVEPRASFADSSHGAPPSEEPESADPVDDLIVGYEAAEIASTSHEPERAGEAGTTSYPTLPSTETGDSDPTDVVLREIRDRLMGKPHGERRRIRRWFTVGAGAGALAAVAALVVDLQFGVVPLPAWLPL